MCAMHGRCDSNPEHDGPDTNATTATRQPIAIIPAADFLYLAHFASDKEPRCYLNGVAIQPSAGGSPNGLTMVATDGHRMGIIRQWPEEGWIDHAGFVLATDKSLIRACKGRKGDYVFLVCYQDRMDVINGPVPDLAEVLNGAYGIAPSISLPAKSIYVDGPFPDWRRALPPAGRKASGMRQTKRGGGSASCVGINAEYLASFAAPKKTTDSGAPIAFDWDGENAIIVTNADPRFLGVVMPMRSAHDAAAIAAQRAWIVDGIEAKTEKEEAACPT